MEIKRDNGYFTSREYSKNNNLFLFLLQKKIPEECVPFANVKKKLYINPI